MFTVIQTSFKAGVTDLHLRCLQPFHAEPVMPDHLRVADTLAVFAVEVRIQAPLEPPRPVSFACTLRLRIVVVPGTEWRIMVIFERVAL